MSETRYAFVARSITARIASGEFPVGAVMPKEVVLAEQFGVSRATIRLALSELQQLGLVSRRRNAGTRVESDQPVADRRNLIQSVGSIEDLVQYADETDRVIVEIVDTVADRPLAERLGVPLGRQLLRVSHIRKLSDPEKPPICWTDIYLDGAFASLRAILPQHRGLIGSLVEATFGRRIVEVRQAIRAGGVPRAVANALRAKPDDHALEITRRYLDQAGSPLLVTISVHPAGRFTYELSLLRSRLD